MRVIIEVKNKDLQIAVSSRGAELQNLIWKGKEYLWQGDPAFWTGRAPVLFPVCGAFNEESYIHQGRKYKMPKHGFALNSEFTLKEKSDKHCVFLLKHSEDTRAIYPFEFDFEVVFTLFEDSLLVDYKTTNTGDVALYYAVGAHEAYACPEGIENYRLVFPTEENLQSNLIVDGALSRKKASIPNPAGVLKLKQDYFEIDALIFENIKSKSVILENPKRQDAIKVSYDDFDHLLIWTKPRAPYICIEPWQGFPDYPDSDSRLSQKQSIIKLLPGESKSLRHTIEFLEK